MTKTILVTGGNGFLALHIIRDLLVAGYNVRATVRSQQKAAMVTAAMQAHAVPHQDQLSFVKLDLTQDRGWDVALKGVDAIMSVAAPVFVNGEKTSDAMAQTATNGTLRILKAATKAGIKRVIMTGNFGAVGFSNKDRTRVTQADDWTDPDEPGLSLYERSKLLAERAAWQFVDQHADAPELTTIDAGAMLGTAMTAHVSGSFGIVKNLLTGSRVPNIPFTVVAADDVADMHVQALAAPAAGQRFLAVADEPIDYQHIAALIRRERPQLAQNINRTLLPAALIRLVAPFNARAREARLMMRISHRVSNDRARSILNWQPKFSAEQAVLAAVDALASTGQLK